MDKLKKQISKTGSKLYKKGFASGCSGNISVKVDNNILITPSGFNLAEVEEEDVIVLDLEGNVICGSHKASSEKKLHTEIYKIRPDINSVIHAHLPKCTAFSIAGIPLDKPIHSEVVFTFPNGVPIAEYAMPSTDELAINTAKYFNNNDAVLMANHGAVVVGKDLREAYFKLETLEFYAELSLYTKILGNANELSKDQVNDLIDLRKKFFH